MFSFGSSSTTRLNTCHPDIQKILNKALSISDIDMSVICGYRSEEEQEKAFEQGNSKAHYGESPHNMFPFSLAVDVAPYVNGEVQWHNTTAFDTLSWYIHKAQKDLFERHEISHLLENGFEKWGWDRPHWQIIGWKSVEQ